MIECENGTDLYAVRLIIALIAAAMLLVISLAFIKSSIEYISVQSIRADTCKLTDVCRLEYVNSPEVADGTHITWSLSGGARKVVLGSTNDLEKKYRVPNAYFIEYQNGVVETYYCDVPFAFGDPSSEKVLDSPVVLYPGTYELKIKTAYCNGRPVAAIFGGYRC